MKIFKFILKNYFTALVVLLMTLGSIFWLRPERGLELAVILTPMSVFSRFWMLLSINFLWSISFILFDLWNMWRVSGINLGLGEIQEGDKVLFVKSNDVDDESGFQEGVYGFIVMSIDDDGMIVNEAGDLFEVDELKLIKKGGNING